MSDDDIISNLDTLNFMPWERVSEIARNLWGPRVLVYRSTTNNFFFVTLLPDHSDNPYTILTTGIMPSDVLGYGKTWSEAFGMAIFNYPFLIPEPLVSPPKIKPKKEHNYKNWDFESQPLIPKRNPIKKK